LHVNEQAPPVHVGVALATLVAQALPHDPQLGTVVVSTHAPLHSACPALHAKPHDPALHTAVAFATLVVQELPQRPQFCGSAFVFAHVPPHVRPHAPALVQHFVHPNPHDAQAETVHAGVALSVPPASPPGDASEAPEHTPAWHVAPTALQFWHAAPAVPQVVSDAAAQLPLGSQQPAHVCGQAPPSAPASLASSPASALLPSSPDDASGPGLGDVESSADASSPVMPPPLDPASAKPLRASLAWPDAHARHEAAKATASPRRPPSRRSEFMPVHTDIAGSAAKGRRGVGGDVGSAACCTLGVPSPSQPMASQSPR
jgi:hypothetical protein